MILGIQDLVQFLVFNQLDGYFLTNSCEFDIENTPQSLNYLELLTGFSGSNGQGILLSNGFFILFTDSRYEIQAKLELFEKFGENFAFTTARKSSKDWESFCSKYLNNSKSDGVSGRMRIGFNARNTRAQCIESFHRGDFEFIATEFDLKILEKSSKSDLFNYELKFSGETTISKLEKLACIISHEFIFLNSPTSIAWLLNIRDKTQEFIASNLCFAIFAKSKFQLEIFTTEVESFQKILKISDENYTSRVQIRSIIELDSTLKLNAGQIALCNGATFYQRNLASPKNSKADLIFDPIPRLSSIKNCTEISNSARIHILDGVAIVKFWYWLEQNLAQKIPTNELNASQKLLEFRRQSAEFLMPSFETISAAGPNSAIVHYGPDLSNANIEPNGIYLLDSGGQYLGGTTDATRTFHFSRPTLDQKFHFTLVLKAHLALLRAKFPTGAPCNQLNSIARYLLWENRLDFKHGVGHGVGNLLGVHEGPWSISENCSEKLIENLILSIEPGLYFESKYGIRIENLAYTKKFFEDFLEFSNLTLIPYDLNLVDFDQLTEIEIEQINTYHMKINREFQPFLEEEIAIWLNTKTKAIPHSRT